MRNYKPTACQAYRNREESTLPVDPQQISTLQLAPHEPLLPNVVQASTPQMAPGNPSRTQPIRHSAAAPPQPRRSNKPPPYQRRIPAIMPQHQNSHEISPDVIEKVIRKPLQIVAPQAAGIKVVKSRILPSSSKPDLKLRKEIISEFRRDFVVAGKDPVQIALDTPMKPNLHDSSTPPPVHRK